MNVPKHATHIQDAAGRWQPITRHDRHAVIITIHGQHRRVPNAHVNGWREEVAVNWEAA